MAAISLTDEQTKLLRLCVKHSDPLKPNWEKVAEEGGLVSTSAASQRWGRLYKVLMGDESSLTPIRGKGSTSKSGEGISKQKNTPKKKVGAPRTSKISEEDMGDEADGTTTTQPATPTRKRAHDGNLGSDKEEEAPTKVKRTEVKHEDEDDD